MITSVIFWPGLIFSIHSYRSLEIGWKIVDGWVLEYKLTSQVLVRRILSLELAKWRLQVFVPYYTEPMMSTNLKQAQWVRMWNVVHTTSTAEYPVWLLAEDPVFRNPLSPVYQSYSRRKLSALCGVTNQDCTCTGPHTLFKVVTSAYSWHDVPFSAASSCLVWILCRKLCCA